MTDESGRAGSSRETEADIGFSRAQQDASVVQGILEKALPKGQASREGGGSSSSNVGELAGSLEGRARRTKNWWGRQWAPRLSPLCCATCRYRTRAGGYAAGGYGSGAGPLNQNIRGGQTETGGMANPFTALIPWLTSAIGSSSLPSGGVDKPSRYLVVKGIPTIPLKSAEKIWKLDYVEMEEFLPAPRLAEQGPRASCPPYKTVGWGPQALPGSPATQI